MKEWRPDCMIDDETTWKDIGVKKPKSTVLKKKKMKANTIILPSSIHGLGIFAASSIKRGEEIVQAEKIDLRQNREAWIKYLKRSKQKSFALANGYCLVNHSDQPNTMRTADFSIVATQDIDSGEEILENYHELSDEENPFKNTTESDLWEAKQRQ